MKFPVGRDILERAAKTFFQAGVAVAISDGLDWQDALSLDNWKAYGLAGLAAVTSLATSLVFSRVGRKGASADPGVGLAPVSDSRPV